MKNCWLGIGGMVFFSFGGGDLVKAAEKHGERQD
jgi:hypothetical protein